jgi:hypothetical protein
MAQANRHYFSDGDGHTTHHCHKKEFLLKFARSKKGWIAWVNEAKRRYGLRIHNPSSSPITSISLSFANRVYLTTAFLGVKRAV